MPEAVEATEVLCILFVCCTAYETIQQNSIASLDSEDISSYFSKTPSHCDRFGMWGTEK